MVAPEVDPTTLQRPPVTPGEPDPNVVRLGLPAAPAFVGIARLTATGLASRLEFTLAELDDIRISVDELCSLLVADAPPTSRLDLTFAVDGPTLTVEGCTSPPTRVPSLGTLSARILSVVADQYGTVPGRDGTAFRVSHRHRG